jgi:hypothetical protein
VHERLLSLCGAIPRTTLNAVLCHWVYHLLYQSFYKYIIKVCTSKSYWSWGIAKSGDQFTETVSSATPWIPPDYSWDSILSASTSPKFYPPKFRNWPNLSPRMTSTCLYPQVHDFVIRCYLYLYVQIDIFFPKSIQFKEWKVATKC